MKEVMKILSALAAIIGTAFVIATYGDQIVAWCKKLLSACPICTTGSTAEEAPAEETAETPAAEEAPAEEAQPEAEVEVVIQSNEPVAEENDFES